MSRALSKHAKYVPKHRTPAVGTPKKVLRNTVLLTSVAAAATGVAVSGGVLSDPMGDPVDMVVAGAEDLTATGADTGSSTDSSTTGSGDVAAQDIPTLSAADLAARAEGQASRSDRREPLDPAKQVALSADSGRAITVTVDVTTGDPRTVAQALLGEFGFGQDQFGCLDSLWTRESGWRVNADNPSSSAYGIPQALPGSKMASAGADWATNPATQIRWGLGYIQDRYGSPCGAWGHSQSYGWY